MEHNSVQKIVVVGGGTAGWLTALTAQRSLPNAEITVIESEEIGILGAGEGTTPHIVALLDYLGIPVSKFVSLTNASIKNAIKFTNWKNDGAYYYHNFGSSDPRLNGSNMYYERNWERYNLQYLLNIYCDVPLTSGNIGSLLNEQRKVPHVFSGMLDATRDPILSYSSGMSYGLHFDASQFATVLKEIALSRGITRVEGKVTSINEDHEGFITGLVVNSKDTVLLDFVFDCTGFHRLLIGKHYNSTWKSYKEVLPAKAAVPFFLEANFEEELPTYTDSIAMRYGWMWKIPLQHRSGCGYVYDSDLISEEEAIQEIEEYLGFEPFYPRKDKHGFKFEAGSYTTTWVKNCIALGLSSGFLEPLEATSIMVTIGCLQDIFSNVNHIQDRNSPFREVYNKHVEKKNDEIRDFLYFHYMTGRTDTEFWKKFTFENAPKSLQHKITTVLGSVPRRIESWEIFAFDSWFDVSLGIDMVNKEAVKQFIEQNGLTSLLKEHSEVRDFQELWSNSSTTHRQFLKSLGATFETK
jgi:tryptophan 7-halogenase